VKALLLLLVGASAAHAEVCTGVTSSGGRFATCFDTGNRLSITAGSDGFGGSIALRHEVTFDDEPDLAWKLEHRVAEATYAGYEDRLDAVLYRGRFLRHARDGHIVIPIGAPRKVFLPFDIGGRAELGRLAWRPGSSLARVGVVEIAGLIDLARTRSFRRRLAVGPVARWDIELDRDDRALAQHVVAPFTLGLVELAAETANGRTSAALEVETGRAWHSAAGAWRTELRASAALERIVIAINDRPIALVVGARYDRVTEELAAHVGARIAILQRRDPRVSLTR
jgi:hypothetical protein